MKNGKNIVSRDLFMCVTPLQMLIAKKIIESPLYDGLSPDLVLVPLSNSEKYKYYFQRLSSHCLRSIKVRNLKFPFNLYYIARYFLLRRYRRIYVASIDSSFFQLLSSFLIFREIRTFDDGTANIFEGSIYYNDNNGLLSKIKRLIFRMSGNRYSRERFINESTVHYTIYPEFKNIVENTEPVKLLEAASFKKNINYGSVSIILGTCYREVVKDTALEKALINEVEIFLKKNVQGKVYYIPHPRDERECLPGIERIADKRVSEELIYDLINAGNKVVLIGFGSSVQFAFLNNESVVNFVMDSHFLKESMRHLAQILINHGGVRINLSEKW